MLKNFIFAGFLLGAISLYGADDDIFTDAEIEVDPSIQDDFSSIEDTSVAPQNFILESYESFGERGLPREEKSISILAANETIARAFHLSLMPQGHFVVWKFKGHLGLALRFPTYDNINFSSRGLRNKGFVDGETFITPRESDYRSFFDAQKLMRRLMIGESSEPFSMQFEREHVYSLGQGDLMKEMSTDGLYDQDYLFGRAQAVFDYAQINAVVGPIIKAEILGLNARFMPFTSLSVAPFVRDINFDVTYVGDYFAPNQVRLIDDSFVLDEEMRLLERQKGTAQALSAAFASKWVPLHWLSLKPYFAYSHLFLTDPDSYGAGVSLGHDLAFYFGHKQTDSSLIFKSEGRLFSQAYQPSYFGDNYMLDRQILVENTSMPITKSQFIYNDQNISFRYGYLFELAYFLNKIFNTKVSYENARFISTNNPMAGGRKLRLLAGLLGQQKLRFQAAYQATSIGAMREVFNFSKSRGLLALKGQFQVMPYLYLDAWVKHAFGLKDIYQTEDPQWLSSAAETRSLNVGLGLELAMAF